MKTRSSLIRKDVESVSRSQVRNAIERQITYQNLAPFCRLYDKILDMVSGRLTWVWTTGGLANIWIYSKANDPVYTTCIVCNTESKLPFVVQDARERVMGYADAACVDRLRLLRRLGGFLRVLARRGPVTNERIDMYTDWFLQLWAEACF